MPAPTAAIAPAPICSTSDNRSARRILKLPVPSCAHRTNVSLGVAHREPGTIPGAIGMSLSLLLGAVNAGHRADACNPNQELSTRIISYLLILFMLLVGINACTSRSKRSGADLFCIRVRTSREILKVTSSFLCSSYQCFSLCSCCRGGAWYDAWYD